MTLEKYMKQQGFTLIELVIVVAIVGILSSIALPLYRDYVVRANRTEAKTALLGMATGEAQACLNHLRGRGEAVMELDADGVAWWRAA